MRSFLILLLCVAGCLSTYARVWFEQDEIVVPAGCYFTLPYNAEMGHYNDIRVRSNDKIVNRYGSNQYTMPDVGSTVVTVYDNIDDSEASICVRAVSEPVEFFEPREMTVYVTSYETVAVPLLFYPYYANLDDFEVINHDAPNVVGYIDRQERALKLSINPDGVNKYRPKIEEAYVTVTNGRQSYKLKITTYNDLRDITMSGIGFNRCVSASKGAEMTYADDRYPNGGRNVDVKNWYWTSEAPDIAKPDDGRGHSVEFVGEGSATLHYCVKCWFSNESGAVEKDFVWPSDVSVIDTPAGYDPAWMGVSHNEVSVGINEMVPVRINGYLGKPDDITGVHEGIQNYGVTCSDPAVVGLYNNSSFCFAALAPIGLAPGTATVTYKAYGLERTVTVHVNGDSSIADVESEPVCGEYEFYNLAGVRVGSAPSLESVSLPAGIYIWHRGLISGKIVR